MTARHPAATVAAALTGGIVVLGIVAALGCTRDGQQRTATAVAIAAVSADLALQTAYDVAADRIADEVLDDVGEGDDAVREWCERMVPVWEGFQRADCAIRALGDLAITGQRLIDVADGDEVGSAPWFAWVAAVAPVVHALVDLWTAIDDDPPPELLHVADMVQYTTGSEPDTRCVIKPMPQCEGVL